MTNRRPLPKALTGIVVGLATVALFLTSAAPMASAAPFAYMANMGSETVSIVDAAQPDNVYTLPNVAQGDLPFSLPADIAVNPVGTRAYVANFGDNTVSVIDTASVESGVSHKVVAKIGVGMMPSAIAVHPTGSTVYVANGDGTISVIDAGTLKVIDTMVGFGNLMGIAVNRAGTRLYVTDEISNSVFSIDLTGSGSRVQIDLASPPPTIRSMVRPMGIAVNPAGTRVYVAATDSQFDDGGVVVIDAATNTIERVILVGTRPIGVAVNPSGSLVYVTSEGDGYVSVIYTRLNTIVENVSFPRAHGVALDPTGEYVFIAHAVAGKGRVSIMNASHAVIAFAAAGQGPASFGAFASGGPMPTGPSGPSGDQTALQKLLDEAKATIDTLRTQLDAATSATATLQDAYDKAMVTIARLKDEYQQSNMTIASFIRRLMTGRTDENVALAARDAAQQQLGLASARMGTRDPRVRHAQKHMNKGLAALAAGHYQRAVKYFAEAYETCWRLHW